MGDEAPAALAADAAERALALVRERGGRVTPARRLLLEAMMSSPWHHTARELAVTIRARVPGIRLSTIYRNLDEFCRLRVVDCTYAGHGPATYHLASGSHGHLACEQCGVIAELPGEAFLALAEAAMGTHGFVIAPPRFAVPGLCANCQETGTDGGQREHPQVSARSRTSAAKVP